MAAAGGFRKNGSVAFVTFKIFGSDFTFSRNSFDWPSQFAFDTVLLTQKLYQTPASKESRTIIVRVARDSSERPRLLLRSAMMDSWHTIVSSNLTLTTKMSLDRVLEPFLSRSLEPLPPVSFDWELEVSFLLPFFCPSPFPPCLTS